MNPEAVKLRPASFLQSLLHNKLEQSEDSVCYALIFVLLSPLSDCLLYNLTDLFIFFFFDTNLANWKLSFLVFPHLSTHELARLLSLIQHNFLGLFFFFSSLHIVFLA